MTLYADRVSRISTENAFKMGPYIKEVEDAGHKVVKCNIGEPDFPLPAHIREEVKRQLDLDLTHYCDPQGILPLREAIARDMGPARGLPITPDRVVVFAGAKPPIGFCQEAYCNPGDEVIYPSPGFPIYESFTQYVGAKPVPLHLSAADGWRFSAAALSKLITSRTKMIYLNFPSNPTGAVAGRAQLEELADVIRRQAPPDLRVYSDEVYEKILYDGRKHSSIASLPGMAERTVIISGVSKSFSWTGGRVGWAVFPTAAEAAVFKNFNINYFSCIPAYNQMGAKVGLESPETEPTIRKMVAAFQERRDAVLKRIAEIPGITCTRPEGAFYVWPDISGVCANIGAIAAWESLPADTRARTSPSTLFQMFLLFRHHVATLDRRSFGGIGSEGKHFLRFSVATSMPDLMLGMERLGKAVKDSAGFAAFVKEGKRLF